MERYQHTIRHAICAKGIGLHSGEDVVMVLKPAKPNTGIVFKRTDLRPAVSIKLVPGCIQDTQLCSALVEGSAKVSTVEHLLSAISAFEIDNILIELSAPEVPIMDGSSAPFCFLLDAAGRIKQEKLREYKRILKPIRVADGDKFAEFVPTTEDNFHLNFSIDFDDPVISATPSDVSYTLEPRTYSKEVARARSFGFKKDLDYLHANDLGLGASLDNVIGIDKDGVMNPAGLRYEDEFVRHKLLDAIGDLYAAGPIIGSFTGYKSGHALNNQLLRKMLAEKDCFETTTLDALQAVA